jgi:hypothetical protein
MSHNYDDAMFGSNDDNQTQTTTMDAYEVRKWTLGDHASRPTTTETQLATDAARQRGVDDELAELMEAAAARVPDFEMYDFECPACGLNHGHDDKKHDIRAAFNVTGTFAELMEFNAACHCGVNELAMLLDFFDSIETQVFDDQYDLAPSALDSRFAKIRNAAESATLANTTEERIESIRGGLEADYGDADDDDESPSGTGSVIRGP